MARKPSPWYWPERHGWYTILNGKRERLLDLPAETPRPKKRGGRWVVPPAVQQLFHIMSAQLKARPAVSPLGGPTVAEILDKYLEWCHKHRARRTFEWYHDHLQGFLNHLGSFAAMPASELKPFHVIEWTDTHEDWSSSYRRGAIIAVQRPFNWARELGYIPASPVEKIAKPQPQRRDNPMSPDDFAGLLTKVKEGDPFQDFLIFAWETGARPQEIRHLEPRHVHLSTECIVIPKEEAKGKKRPRVIHLQGRALEIVTRRMRECTGKLFKNSKGRPWKKFAICNRFDRLMLSFGMDRLKELGVTVPPVPRFNRLAYADKAGLVAARKEQQRQLRDRRKQIIKLAREHGKRFACVDSRHGFCQRLLENGANHLAVAELMGHSTGRMVAETYSHTNRATSYLKETLKKASSNAEA